VNDFLYTFQTNKKLKMFLSIITQKELNNIEHFIEIMKMIIYTFGENFKYLLLVFFLKQIKYITIIDWGEIIFYG